MGLTTEAMHHVAAFSDYTVSPAVLAMHLVEDHKVLQDTVFEMDIDLLAQTHMELHGNVIQIEEEEQE